MATKKTHDQFLSELEQRNLLFPTEQITLQVSETYVNLDTPLTFNCLNGHPDFSTSPRHILIKKSGCPQCGTKRAGTKNTKTHNAFVQQLNNRNTKFPTVVLLEDERYSGVHNKLKFKCEDTSHVSWSATPAAILQGHGCPQCGALLTKATHQYTIDQLTNLIDVHNELSPHKKVYLQENQQYKGYKSPLKFTCDFGHDWITNPDNILNGKSGCPFCAISKTFSIMAIDWLTEVAHQENIFIIHKGNSDKEYHIPNTKYLVDGYCEETNTVYEFHGNYWHGNPRLFNKDDINDRVNRSYGELYADTIKKESIIKSLGYNLIVIWEDEYNKNKYTHKLFIDFYKKTKQLNINAVLIPISQPYNKYYYINQLNQSKSNQNQTIFIFEDEWINNSKLVLHKLKHYDIDNVVTRIHARKCTIKQITNSDKKELLNSCHVQGNDNAMLSYGAYYNDILIAVMTFTSPRLAVGAKGNNTNKEGIWELSRFCTDVNYRIPGIASKLLTHFKRNHTWKEIYSFADKRWSIGNMYHQLGFELVADNPPAYFYVIAGKRKHRWNYRKDILKNTLPNYDASLTEYQNMVNNGYWRVWDCGTLKFNMVHNFE